MKGNQKILEVLNKLLEDELTAVTQYVVQAEIFESWGYKKLHKMFMDISLTEMKHVEKHIERIIFLGGKVTGLKIKDLEIGEDTEKIIRMSKDSEKYAIDSYNDAIKLCQELNDNGTKQMLESILLDEEKHYDLIESQLEQIKQMGIQTYLSTQTED